MKSETVYPRPAIDSRWVQKGTDWEVSGSRDTIIIVKDVTVDGSEVSYVYEQICGMIRKNVESKGTSETSVQYLNEAYREIHEDK